MEKTPDKNQNILNHINNMNKKVDNIMIMFHIQSIMMKLNEIEFLLYHIITNDRQNKWKDENLQNDPEIF